MLNIIAILHPLQVTLNNLRKVYHKLDSRLPLQIIVLKILLRNQLTLKRQLSKREVAAIYLK